MAETTVRSIINPSLKDVIKPPLSHPHNNVQYKSQWFEARLLAALDSKRDSIVNNFCLILGANQCLTVEITPLPSDAPTEGTVV